MNREILNKFVESIGGDGRDDQTILFVFQNKIDEESRMDLFSV